MENSEVLMSSPVSLANCGSPVARKISVGILGDKTPLEEAENDPWCEEDEQLPVY